MRLDGVEIKTSFDGAQVAQAVARLGLGDAARWKVYFLEDVTPGLEDVTPLLDRHVILRARQKDNGKDDVTVKFRPGRRSQLTDDWLARKKTEVQGLDSELKVEEDWARERVLSIALTAERPDDLVADVADGRRPVEELFTADQAELIDSGGDSFVNLRTLSLLPPISARRWRSFTVQGPGPRALDLRAERWTVADLDFLELSIVEDVEQGEAAQAALLGFVADQRLVPSDGGPKTTQVLRTLVAAAARLP
jgi:hypothetical protein